MAQQVITVDAFGSIAGLQHKQGQGVDLRTFGKADICRASEVLWDTDMQKWYVEFREGANEILNGVKLTQFMLSNVLPDHPASTATADVRAVAYFAEYDEAIQVEIAYLNHHRLLGHIV